MPKVQTTIMIEESHRDKALAAVERGEFPNISQYIGHLFRKDDHE